MEAKQQFLSQAEDMFMKYGIKSVSMDDIARKLGMSKKTLYQFVENKADLITQIFHEYILGEKRAMEDINDQSSDAVEEIIGIAKYIIRQLSGMSPKVLYDLQKYYRKVWQLMEGLHQQYTFQVIKNNIERGIKEGLYRKNIQPEIVARLYIANSSLIVDDQLFPLENYHSENLFKELINYHIHGIASVEGLKLLAKYSKDLL